MNTKPASSTRSRNSDVEVGGDGNSNKFNKVLAHKIYIIIHSMTELLCKTHWQSYGVEEV